MKADKVQLWSIRVMLVSPEGDGAEPIWCYESPCVPARGDQIAPLRSMLKEKSDTEKLTGYHNGHYRVVNVCWVLATGPDADPRYSVDVTVRPL